MQNSIELTFLFFNISGGEIFIIVLFILIFFGADKIPEIARTFGRTIRQVKDATGEIQKDIQSSVKDVKDQLKDAVEEPKTGKKS